MSEFGSIIDLHTLGRPKTVSRPQLRPDIPEQKTDTHSSSEAQSARPSPSGRYSPVTMTLRTPQPVSSCATSQSQREPEYLVRRRDQQVRAFRRSLHERTLEAVLGRASPVSLREELALLEAKVRAGALTPGDATDTALDKVLRAAAGTSGSEDMKMMNTK